MSEVVVLNKRKINVVNVGGKNFTMESTANNRGELEAEMSKLNMGVAFKDKKVIIGETKNSLDVPGALLPSSNFTLFIMPAKTKAGGEARNKVKELMKKYPVEAKAHFSAEKSYTVTKDAELEELLKTWKEPKEVTAPKVKEKEKRGRPAKEVAGLVDTVLEHKKKYESHTMTGESYQKAKEEAKQEQIGEADIITVLKSIHAVVLNNAGKLDQILGFAGGQAKTNAMPVVLSEHSVYAEPVNQLENGEIDKVKRQIEREFPDVRS